MSDLSIKLTQLDMDVETLRAEVDALKNELAETRKESMVTAKALRLLCASLGFNNSKIENILAVARRGVEDAKIPQ